jgi:subtilase family protein
VYGADNGARVTNNSWGDTEMGPQVYIDAMNYADGLDVLQVAAAGNQADENLFWPAAFDKLLAVSSTDVNDNLSGFSTHGDWIDCSAPGEGIYNLWIGNSTAWLSGTSMASPHVAGAGALIRSLNPQLSALEAFLVLRHHSDDLGPSGFDNDYGWGRLDVKKAVDAARSLHLSSQSMTAPGSIDLDLDMDSEAGMLYLLLASPAGELPGIPLSGFDASDARILNLNYDFFISFLLQVRPNPIGQDFLGFLDGSGHADASFVIPGGAYFPGKDFSFSYLTFDPGDLAHVRRISAPLTVSIDP